MRPIVRRPLVLALCLAALGGTAVWAGPLDRHADADRRVDDRLERMTKDLNLTAEQQSQVRALIDEQHAAIDRLRQETRKRIDAILTDAQRAERDRRVERLIDRRVERMTKRLDLTTEQATQVRAIYRERREDPDLTRSEVRERIAAVLTEEQRKKLDSMNERRGGRGPEPDAERGPGPGL